MSISKGPLGAVICVCVLALLLVEGDNYYLGNRLVNLKLQLAQVRADLAKNDGAIEARAAKLSRLKDFAPPAAGTDPMTAFSQSPQYRSEVLNLRTIVTGEYAQLLRRLRLSAGAREKFEKLLLEKNVTAAMVADSYTTGEIMGVNGRNLDPLKPMIAASTQDLDDEIRGIIGSPAFEQYQEYTGTIKYRVQASDFTAQFAHSAVPISDDQTDRLTTLLAETDSDPALPLAEAFPARAAVIFGANQTGAVQESIEVVRARRAIVELNLAAIKNGQISPNLGGGRFLVQKL